ncbi:NAD(P)/FAD-dependent oxidoreductase [Sporomusa sp.]|uniref:NAD(P)/FAD-dependent oxidoreductase n=1 Tax=Sporomusa sp. TaxID=2078658 RepID=UPI002B82D704|nr:NAD(P)/FAD-dependent oxidoreductase [Sporomusa sp.]HWR44733.1 NAD(P)/FAD-dependent oxidoreductase [Sporomusa sp.]
MRTVEVVVIGAGPAGLSAAVEAGKAGAKVLVLDENSRPGGQLFKQIHKFFGSKEHLAGVRGYDLGCRLLQETADSGAEICLDVVVHAIYPDKKVAYIAGGKEYHVSAGKIILATGASENALAFPGCTLPGVMSAGALQTMMNIQRVLPADKVLMVGSGNVGLIVSYQILQAGGRVAALVEAAPHIGGYGVHAAKITRAGVPVLVSHTVKYAYGRNRIEGAVIAAVDDHFQIVPDTERWLEVGCIAIAVGLTPLTELAHLCGCQFTYIARLGGLVPLHDENMEATVPGIYVAGDITGVEEASSAMEEGRLAGIAAAAALGYIPPDLAALEKQEVWCRLNILRTGAFGAVRQAAKSAIMDERRQPHVT